MIRRLQGALAVAWIASLAGCGAVPGGPELLIAPIFLLLVVGFIVFVVLTILGE